MTQSKRQLIYHTHVPVHDEVVASSEKGEFLSRLEDIAKDGITLSCDRETLDQLLPNTLSIAPRQPKQLEVSFTLPEESSPIHSHCEVYSLRRLSRNCFQLAMKFMDIAENDLERVTQFIDGNFQKTCTRNDLLVEHAA